MADTEDHRMSLFAGRARSIDLVDRVAELARRPGVAMTAEDRLVRLRADACDRAADPPDLGELIENTGRQTLRARADGELDDLLTGRIGGRSA